MSWSTVGHCPKCGAPIYVPLIWNGVDPPPNTYTCGCNPQPKIVTQTGGSAYTLPPNTYGDAMSIAMDMIHQDTTKDNMDKRP